MRRPEWHRGAKPATQIQRSRSSLGLLHLGASELETLSLAPATRHAYSSALRKFLLHVGSSLLQLADRRSRAVDQLLTDYLNYIHRTQLGSFTDASHTVFGLVAALPHLQCMLPRSRRSFKGWDRHREHRSHPPLTWELTVTLALAMATAGYHGHAVRTLLAFDGYLRISEYTFHRRNRGLRRRDIASAGDVRLGSLGAAMTVALKHTKTGPNRSFSVSNQAVARALQDYLDENAFSADDIVFPFSTDQYRRVFHATTARLGLSQLGLVPHSLRHGGATKDFMQGRTIEQIAHRGRWASIKLAGRYVQQGPALLLYNSVPPELIHAGRTLEPYLTACLTHLRRSVPSSVPAAQAKTVRFQLSTSILRDFNWCAGMHTASILCFGKFEKLQSEFPRERNTADNSRTAASHCSELWSAPSHFVFISHPAHPTRLLL